MSKVSILIAHYSPEAEIFLEKCLLSTSRQTLQPHETILVSSNNRPLCNFKGIVSQHYHSPERLHFPAAIAKAYSLSDPTSSHILILNDDCIMSKDTLSRMVHTMDGFPQEIILNPRSNCSPASGFYYTNSGIVVNGHFIPAPQQLRGDHGGFLEQFIESPLEYPFAMVQVRFAAFFCTLMKRSTYERVGGICEEYKTGSDDLDFAVRALRLGVRCYTALHAPVIHASGVSADKYLTQEDRAFNESLFKSKNL
jgi:GT2 family glycosyltransferase